MNSGGHHCDKDDLGVDFQPHARATRVEVVLCRTPDAPDVCPPLEGAALRITVRDDDAGMDSRPALGCNRFGLVRIRERVQALKGEVCIESRPGHGVCVNVILPVTEINETGSHLYNIEQKLGGRQLGGDRRAQRPHRVLTIGWDGVADH